MACDGEDRKEKEREKEAPDTHIERESAFYAPRKDGKRRPEYVMSVNAIVQLCTWQFLYYGLLQISLLCLCE